MYDTGDTDTNEDNVNVKCDVLLVPCGGKYTFDAEDNNTQFIDFVCKIIVDNNTYSD